MIAVNVQTECAKQWAECDCCKFREKVKCHHTKVV